MTPKSAWILVFLLMSDVCYAFEPTMLVGKWINSDLDQLNITVTQQQITLIRDLKWDGLRPSSRRIYTGKFKPNFIPLLSQHDSVHDYSEILPKEIRRQLIQQKPQDKLILKILNDDNLRVDYYPSVITYESHKPTKIGGIEQSPEREIIRYKRWGRYIVKKVQVKTKNAAQIERKLVQKRQADIIVLNNQTNQLAAKKQALQITPVSSFRQDEKRLRAAIVRLNKTLKAEKKKPLPKHKPRQQDDTEPFISQPKIDYAAIRQRQLEKITQQRDEAIKKFRSRIQAALDNSYQRLPKLLLIRDIDDGALSVASDLKALQQRPQQGFYQQPTVETVVFRADKIPVYQARQHSPRPLPEDVLHNATLFARTQAYVKNTISTLWQLRKRTQQMLTVGHAQIKSLDQKTAQRYLRQIQAHPNTDIVSLLTPVTVNQRAQIEYSSACFAHTTPPKAGLEQYANRHNNQWLFALDSFNQSFSQLSQQRQKSDQPQYLAARSGEPEGILTSNRLNAILQIGARQRQANKIRLQASSEKKKTGKKARKKRKKAKKQYQTHTKFNQKALITLQQAPFLEAYQQRLKHQQTRQAKLDALIQNPQTWAALLAQCSGKLTDPAPQIAPQDFPLISKDLQLSVLKATSDLYWDIHQAWMSQTLEGLTLTFQQQQLLKQISQFQTKNPRLLKKTRNSPFQKPTSLFLVIKVSDWKDAIPKVRLHTQYKNIPFKLKPKQRKISRIPGAKQGEYWQEIHYFFDKNAFKHADQRSKLVLQIDFSPHQ